MFRFFVLWGAASIFLRLGILFFRAYTFLNGKKSQREISESRNRLLDVFHITSRFLIAFLVLRQWKRGGAVVRERKRVQWLLLLPLVQSKARYSVFQFFFPPFVGFFFFFLIEAVLEISISKDLRNRRHRVQCTIERYRRAQGTKEPEREVHTRLCLFRLCEAYKKKRWKRNCAQSERQEKSWWIKRRWYRRARLSRKCNFSSYLCDAPTR